MKCKRWVEEEFTSALNMDGVWELNGAYVSAANRGSVTVTGEVTGGSYVSASEGGSVTVAQGGTAAFERFAGNAGSLNVNGGLEITGDSTDETASGAVLYLGAHYEVDEGQGILITPDARHDAANPGVITGTGTGQGALTLPVNGLEMTEGGALVVSQALAYDSTGTDAKAAVTFKAANATVKTDKGSQIVLDRAQILGNQTVKLFADADGAVDASQSEADIYAANGILKGTMDSSGNVTFAVDADKAASSMTAMSSPVRGLAVKVLTNGGNAYDTADAGVGYISYVNADRGGKAIEETARMAVYGGAVQAARLASGMTADTVDARLNGQAASGIISSETYEGAGIWFTPVYRNLNSDGFDADGASYGADVDLYGAMLGADYSFGNGVKAGGFFGTGTGDGDGAETGSDVSSDFDWWNIGLYAGWTSGAWQVTGDLSYTELSADMDQSTGSDLYGTLSADTDVTALSLGVTGEYTFSTAWMDITPHAGLRWTQLDMDSYSVKGHGGTIAQSDADAMNVFSLPAGVTFATEVTSGQFTVKPYADLTLAANFGDTELDSDVTFTGAESTGLTSEVIDDFTYGVALGLNVAYGEALTFGIGASWTGSENADSVGVSGNVRYAF